MTEDTDGQHAGMFARRVAMDREELKAAIDELMRQYQDGEIDGDTYAQAMMDLTASAREAQEAQD